MEAIAIRGLAAIAIWVEARPSLIAIAIRLDAIATRVNAIALRLEAKSPFELKCPVQQLGASQASLFTDCRAFDRSDVRKNLLSNGCPSAMNLLSPDLTYDILYTFTALLKSMCGSKRPNVQVEEIRKSCAVAMLFP